MYDTGTKVKKSDYSNMLAQKHGFDPCREVGEVINHHYEIGKEYPVGMIVDWGDGVTVETRETVTRLTRKEAFQVNLGNPLK